jgi:hypothetical protein
MISPERVFGRCFKVVLLISENNNILGILTRSDTMLYFYDLLSD